uniref:protein-glutamine gamma-glutamyltransferase n=1 Tax=Gouania willdenowi TaxID=441366 RepID=A0A8C5EC85_GOUWI
MAVWFYCTRLSEFSSTGFLSSRVFPGIFNGHCQLKFVNFEAQENTVSHETQGLSKTHLVVRRGKPFKITLVFDGRVLNPPSESLMLEVRLGSLSERIPVQFCKNPSHSQAWSAIIAQENIHFQSVTIHVCSPVLSSVGLYHLLLHIKDSQIRVNYALGHFALLFNPWLKDDPVFMPLDVHIQEYVKSDYGLIYMGTHLNVCKRPWSFGQYEPGVLEACLQLLQVSPQHLSDKHLDYVLRSDPVYISRVICAMVNCNDDMGILEGRWQGSYKSGTKPTEWSNSADILNLWVSSQCSPVRYGQCWVFASVLCTVMRVLGIPSRVVTVFNAAHDSDSNVKITEFYTSRGEKLGVSKDSIWNFHVWVECWMRRPDLGTEFDGWQVVDPTPQEKSAGVFCCGPCPVAAIQRRYLGTPYDAPFIYASVDADVVRLIVRDGVVVGRTVDTECVGQQIYTKSVDSDRPENLTHKYKGMKMTRQGETLSTLEVSLSIDRVPVLGESIRISVKVTNHSNRPRILRENISAQLKEFNRSPQESFWTVHREVHIKPCEALLLHHSIPQFEYASVLAGDDIVNVAVVMKDVKTKERVLAAQEFNISPPKIHIEVEGGDFIQTNQEHTAFVSFTNQFTECLIGAVLTVEAPGLVPAKQETRLVLLEPGKKMDIKVSIKATSPGTKLLMATFSHNYSPCVVSRCFRRVSVTTA